LLKRILILSTGGTIASVKTKEGLTPKLGPEDIFVLAGVDRNLASVEFKEILNIDSSLMQPEDWELIAKEVFASLQKYDGIVVTHGTDTLAYTASMLSFMLKNLKKPVVLTGAMIPAGMQGSDARRNLRDALLFASSDFGGVFVAFAGKIMRGSRASKVSTVRVDAFDSINYPVVAYISDDGKLSFNVNPTELTGRPELDAKWDSSIFLLKLTPGIDPIIIGKLVEMGYRGLVLECFGSGGLPYRKRDLLKEVEKVANTLPIILTTQVPYGIVDLREYEIGVRAMRAGAISAYDMTREACVTKLMWALGHSSDVEDIRRIVHMNVSGEVSIPSEEA